MSGKKETIAIIFMDIQKSLQKSVFFTSKLQKSLSKKI